MDNYDVKQALADVIKRTREREGLTQEQVAVKAELDTRTVLNIENCNNNPKLVSLSALIRGLYIDPREVFFSDMGMEGQMTRKLRLLLSEVTETEAAALIPILEAVLSALRNKQDIV